MSANSGHGFFKQNKDPLIKLLLIAVLTFLLIIIINLVGITLLGIYPNPNVVQKRNAVFCFNENLNKGEKSFKDCIDNLGIK